MPQRRCEPLDLLLPIAGIVSLVLLAEALDLSPPLALGALFGLLYLGLLARRTIHLASLPSKRRSTARNPRPA